MQHALNRVTLIGYLDEDPQTIGQATSHELVTFNVITKDCCQPLTGVHHIKLRKHKVTVMDYAAKQYAHMFLHKGDCILVEGQLDYVDGSSGNGDKGIETEIIIASPQGHLRRLNEAPVT